MDRFMRSRPLVCIREDFETRAAILSVSKEKPSRFAREIIKWRRGRTLCSRRGRGPLRRSWAGGARSPFVARYFPKLTSCVMVPLPNTEPLYLLPHTTSISQTSDLGIFGEANAPCECDPFTFYCSQLSFESNVKRRHSQPVTGHLIPQKLILRHRQSHCISFPAQGDFGVIYCRYRETPRASM